MDLKRKLARERQAAIVAKFAQQQKEFEKLGENKKEKNQSEEENESLTDDHETISTGKSVVTNGLNNTFLSRSTMRLVSFRSATK